MKLSITIILGLVLVALARFTSLASPSQAEAASADQVAAGRKLAERACGACHVVTGQRDQVPLLALPAPSFPVLAQRSEWTERSLREFLSSNHHYLGPAQAMPNPRLADYQIDEIVAYFMTLKAPDSFRFSDPGK